MAAQNPTPEQQQADILLTESVAVPAFVRKLASDYNVVPDAETHADYRILAGAVSAAVGGFMAKRASQIEESRRQAAKSALDSAFAVAGTQAPSTRAKQAAAMPTDEFFKFAGVAEAAAALTTKQAEHDCPPGTPEPTKAPALDDEEETEKVLTPAA